MNIAHFASAFYPSLGGVQEFVRQLALQQRLDGDAPLLLTNRWPKTLPAQELYEGVPLRRFVFRVPEPNWRQFAGAAVWAPPTLLRIVQVLRAHHTELIHIQCVSSNAYYALHASRLLKLPLVATLHGELTVDAGGVFQRSAFARRLLRAVLERADAITACSSATLHDAEAFYGKPFGPRGQAIHNGVRLEEFCGIAPHPHPRPYLLALGRHVRQKGFDVLLRSFRIAVHNGLREHDLLLAGDGQERDALGRLAQALGLEGRVHFLGGTDRATTARLFAGCAFFVLPSRQEPLGIVNLEAMASGKAVLATRVGGVPEIVENGRTGFLVEPNDAEALARGILRLAAAPHLCARLGAAGREAAARLNWPAIAASYACLYHSVRGSFAPRAL
ncbi:MAG: glycosyltransferase family 4 protein [Verrucomicrobiota bacterium]